ncbi:unnamed protein product [Ambrosiozyma monospora]|uniref:Unnamed protein product n=1 Tax=Ambrosiozyma monospora TaxID=43982 RepID=A0A9W7DGX8_AMBMO|nr:unnamed protein product [Ambrosiozyma monospora]
MPEGTVCQTRFLSPVGNTEPYHFILDPSALSFGGISKIKKWMNDQKVVFFIPNYTLRELDFLKTNYNSMVSLNSRESIRFIDDSMSKHDSNNMFSTAGLDVSDNSDNDEDDYDALDSPVDEFDDVDDFESFNRKKQEMLLKQRQQYGNGSAGSSNNSTLNQSSRGSLKSNKKFKSHFVLESPEEAGPDWKRASGYRRRTPLKSEFPMRSTGFGFMGTSNVNSVLSLKKAAYKEDELPTLDGPVPNDDHEQPETEKAFIPKRLKFLVRSCIQKQFVENKNLLSSQKIDWPIICEDQTTLIWLKCFGLKVATLNEVDLLFKGRGPLANPSPRSSENGKDEPTLAPEPEQQHYTVIPKKNSRKSRKKIVKPRVRIGEDGIQRESYNTITFAPRGQGQLWTP